MSVNPVGQRRAMFTIQRGPNDTSNSSSVTIDASSIEPVSNLSESPPKREDEPDAKNTKIIAIMGLDTISNTAGFEDFNNYFALRSVESELCQKVIDAHLSHTSASEAHKSFLIDRARDGFAAAKVYLATHTEIKRITTGIATSGNSDIPILFNTIFKTQQAHAKTKGMYEFRFLISANDIVPDSYKDTIENILGIDMTTYRSSLQYCRLAIESSALLIPRTSPRYLDPECIRTIESSPGHFAGYHNTENRTLGFPEMSLAELAQGKPIAPTRSDSPTFSRQKCFYNFSNFRLSKIMGGYLYLIDRDVHLSSLSPEVRSSIYVGDRTRNTLDEVVKYMDGRSTTPKILKPMVSSPVKLQIEDQSSKQTESWFRIFPLENYGISDTATGLNAANAKWTSGGQIYSKIQGTPGLIDSIEKIMSEREGSFSDAIESLNTFSTMHGKGIISHIGKFIKDLEPHIGRTFRLIEKSKPSFFQANAGTIDTGDTASAYWDNNRWKSVGENEEFEENHSLDVKNASGKEEYLERIRGAIADIRTRAGRTARAQSGKLDQIEHLLSEYIERSSGQGFNVAAAGVLHMDSETSSEPFGYNRIGWGLALVIAAMRQRNVTDSAGNFKLNNRVYSRFRHALFTYITADWERSTSSVSSLLDGGEVASNLSETFLGTSAHQTPLDLGMGIRQNTGQGSSRIDSIDTIINSDEALSFKASKFGYIKAGQQAGRKFKVPTAESSRIWYDNITTEDAAVTLQNYRAWLQNDPWTLCYKVNELGKSETIIASGQNKEQFAVNLTAAQSEEYYELGWQVVGSLVGKHLKEFLDIIKSGHHNRYSTGAITSGATKIGEADLDTYIIAFYEIFGMICDSIPIDMSLSHIFHKSSSNKSSMVLVEDVDLRKTMRDAAGGTSAVNSLFTSRSGVHGAQDSADQHAELDYKNVYRKIKSAWYRTAGSHSDGSSQVNSWRDGETSINAAADDTSGHLNAAINFMNEDLNHYNQVMSENEGSDVAIIIPTNLTFTLPRSMGPFSGMSSIGWMKGISSIFINGTITGQSTYTKDTDSTTSHTRYTSEENDAIDSISIHEDYILACSRYFESISHSPILHTPADIDKIPSNILVNASHAWNTVAAIKTFIETSRRLTDGAYAKITDLLENDLQGLFRDAIIERRMQKNFKFFDYTTRDRPIRTLMKFLPKNSLSIQTNDNFNLSKLSCTSEFSQTTRNVIYSYLVNYQITDPRESIIVAGCPAGTDLKNLSTFSTAPLRFNDDTDIIDYSSQRTEQSSSEIRTFKLIATRDLDTASEVNPGINVNRFYNIKFFLLPDSFDGINLDEHEPTSTDRIGWLRSIAKQVKWYYVDQGTVKSQLWNQIVYMQSNNYIKALDDMVESEILKWLLALVSGVLIDQDLMFNETYGYSSAEISIPGFHSRDVESIRASEARATIPFLGINSSLFNSMLVTQDINVSRTVNLLEDPSYLPGLGTKKSLPIDGVAKDLVIDKFTSRLDTHTGAEVRSKKESDIKPWNIRLAAALSNVSAYKINTLASSMFANPMFDYTMIMRLKADEVAELGPNFIDLLSFECEISNG